MPAQIPPSARPSLISPVRIDQAIPYMLSQHILLAFHSDWYQALLVAFMPDFLLLLELSKFTQNPKHQRQLIVLAGTQTFAL